MKYQAIFLSFWILCLFSFNPNLLFACDASSIQQTGAASATGCQYSFPIEFCANVYTPYLRFELTGATFVEAQTTSSLNSPESGELFIASGFDGTTAMQFDGVNGGFWLNPGPSTGGVCTQITITTIGVPSNIEFTGSEVALNGGCIENMTPTPPVGVPDAEFSYAQTIYCTVGTDPLPQHNTGTDGIYTSSAGLAINSTTGQIDLSNSLSGSYVVTNTIAVPGCPNKVATFTLTIANMLSADFSYSENIYCSADFNQTPVFTTGIAGTFSAPTGLIYNTNTGLIAPGLSTPGTYVMTNTVSVPGCATAISDFSVTIIDEADAQFGYSDLAYCTADVNPLPTHSTGTDGVYAAGSGLAINAATGEIDLANSLEGSYTISNSISTPNCADTAFFSLNIYEAPNAGTSSVIEVCPNDQPFDLLSLVPGNPDTDGFWTPTLASGGNIFDPALDALGLYRYIIQGQAPCQTVLSQHQIVACTPSCPAYLSVNNAVISDNLYQADIEVYSDGGVPATGNVMFKAGDMIILDNNFQVQQGGVFSAEIEGCN